MQSTQQQHKHEGPAVCCRLLATLHADRPYRLHSDNASFCEQKLHWYLAAEHTASGMRSFFPLHAAIDSRTNMRPRYRLRRLRCGHRADLEADAREGQPSTRNEQSHQHTMQERKLTCRQYSSLGFCLTLSATNLLFASRNCAMRGRGERMPM